MTSDIRILKATSAHIPQMKYIWKICFGDEDSYIDFFFINRFESCHGVVATIGDTVVGAMYLLPVKALAEGQTKNGFYEYAIGVLPQYRGKGIYLEMHSKISEYINNNNMFCILSPANHSLAEYYKKQGFTENAYVYEQIIYKTDESESLIFYELDLKAYSNMRNKYISDLNPIIWDDTALEYCLKENKLCKGENLVINCNKKEYFVIARKSESEIMILESDICDASIRQKVTDFLCKRYNMPKAKWLCPKGNLGKLLCGLGYNLNNNTYYLTNILK